MRDTLTVELTPRIEDGQLRLLFEIDGDTRDLNKLEDAIGGRDVAEITLEVRDFGHDGGIYRVYGVVLADDGRTVAEYWDRLPRRNGVRHTFRVRGADSEPERFVVGAIPLAPHARAPGLAPRANAGGFPVPVDTKKNPG